MVLHFCSGPQTDRSGRSFWVAWSAQVAGDVSGRQTNIAAANLPPGTVEWQYRTAIADLFHRPRTCGSICHLALFHKATQVSTNGRQGPRPHDRSANIASPGGPVVIHCVP